MHSPKPNYQPISGAMMVGVGLLLFGDGVWVGFQSRYQATAVIKIAQDRWLSEPRWQGKEVPEAIKAGLAGVYNSLGAVVESLNLTAESRKLQAPEAIAQLKRNADIHPIRGTSLIEIRVASRDSEEAARIANRIAEVNCNPPLVQFVDRATAPTKRVFRNFTRGLSLMVMGGILLAAGLFVWFDARRFSARRPT